ncbi:hypothetical protein ABIC66_001376 [Caulobacter sp. 1776]
MSIDVESRRVRAPSGASNLEPRVFDLLMTLVERPGLTASRDHLIETVWGEVDGSDEALSQAVAKLRRALGDDARAPRFIETVPKLGYRWIFEDPPGRLPPAQRWSLGPAWVAAGAVLAIAVGGAGGVGAYAWAKAAEPRKFEIRKVRMERTADGRCLRQVQVIRGEGVPSAAQSAPPKPSSPGCEAPGIPRELVER